MKARFLALWTVAVVATAASLIVHLTLRFETVRLGYEVGKVRKEQGKLMESQRLLALEAATLRQTDRVETVARGTLGMDVANAPRIIMVGRKAKRMAGRAE